MLLQLHFANLHRFIPERTVNFDEKLASPLAQALARSADGWALFSPEQNESGEIVDFTCRFSNAAMQRLWASGPAGWLLSEKRLPSLPPETRQARYAEAFQNHSPHSWEYSMEVGGGPTLYRETCQRIGTYAAVQIQDCGTGHVSNPQPQEQARHLESELARHIARLNEVERRSDELLAHIHAGVLIYSPDGQIVTFNLAACSILGLTPGQLTGKEAILPGWHFCREDGSDMPVDEYPINRVLGSQETLRDYVLGIQPERQVEPVWCLVNAYPVFENGQVDAVVVSFIDISSQRRLADAAESNRLRAEALLDLNARAHQLDEDTLLEEGLALALRLTGSRMGHLYFIEPDGALRLAACLTHTRSPCITGDILPLDEAGQWADCIRQRKPVIHNDFSPPMSPKGLPRRSSALHRHLGAPTLENGQVVMMIGVANKPGAYDDADIQLLQMLAHDLWKALLQQRTLAVWQADRRRLEQVIAASHAGIWEFHLGEKGAAVTLRQSGQTEYGEEEPLDRFIERIHPQDQPGVLRAISACLIGSNNHYQQEFRLHDAGLDAYRWILASGEVVDRDEAGMPVSMAGTHIDITEQRAVEEQLRLAATVFDSNSEGIMITDPELRILSVNRVFSEVTGYSPEEALGRKPSLLASGQHGADFYVAMWQAIRRDGRWQGEICNRRKDGTLYPEWLSISTVNDEEGKVTHYVGIFSDITERKRQQAHIEFLAFHDPLTGLPNRQLLSDRFMVAHALADRQNQKMALLFLDLDRFKLVNDTLGHQIGDLILTETAGRLTEIVRESDTVCRLGGDEFVILLGGLRSPDEATDVAQAIITSIDHPFVTADHEIRIAISVGIAVYPDDSRNFTELLKKADTALYRAKQEGRHAYRFFTDRMNAYSIARQLQENRLREGLELGELEVYYQPQVSLPECRLVGVEALVRWHHPADGLLLPQSFLSIAEESGLILPIGAFVLKESCLQMKQWLEMGIAPPVLCVNLSLQQIAYCNLVQLAHDALQHADLPAHRLELELSETILQACGDTERKTLETLRGMGLRIAIDDFGAGYSSLANLLQLNAEKLKIDNRFIGSLSQPQSETIVRSTILMAQAMGFSTVAEGVENQEQLEKLIQLGCNGIQGWLIAQAMPAQECTRWLGSYTVR
ncbi:PAS domain S-box-containing protein/diguanylate cyclase (GGDEF) domain-containing protein [Formivibrio citricus]|uniref:PAS domain S-box-containing protein/diguanylate cyclase (GGDEF) domain-containing protein n=1 Tax=Formivibrio citricus TaxID=83765 RepID=A0A1I4WVH5_9NEIS|nr:EAL domain-containing protein [Formivibrio citricus]SFN17110.1 PAS domain S-box-containing protein/diguanylate cyclase (GGDEF) domain-containing protein [Formivibrio citricus]